MNSYWYGLAVAGLYSVFPLVISQTRMVMSEPVFLTFCLIAFLLTEQAARNEEKWWWPLLMSIMITFVIFIRTIGVVFVGSIIFYLLVVRGFRFWKKFLLVFGGTFIIVAIILATTSVNVYNLIPTKYLNDNNNYLIRRFVSNLFPDQSLNSTQEQSPDSGAFGSSYHAGDLKPFSDVSVSKLILYSINQHFGVDVRMAVLPFGGTRDGPIIYGITLQGVLNAAGIIITGLIFYGFILLMIQRKPSIFVLSSIVYILVLMLWTWEDPRLLYPVQPQLEFGFLSGISGLITWITSSKYLSGLRPRQNLFMALLTIGLILIAVIKCFTIEDSRQHIGDLQARTNWVKANSANTAILMTEHPLVDYIYSDRNIVFYPGKNQISSINDFETYLANKNIQYIVVAPEISWQLKYIPTYSDWTNSLFPYLNELTKENKLTLIYDSGSKKIKVYQR